MCERMQRMVPGAKPDRDFTHWTTPALADAVAMLTKLIAYGEANEPWAFNERAKIWSEIERRESDPPLRVDEAA